MITVSGYINYSLFPSNFNNGYVADTLYSKGLDSFLGVYPSDILPPPPSLTRSVTLFLNTDPQTAEGMPLLVIHLNRDPIPDVFSIPVACPLSSLVS